jgi:hypothetical protein
MVEEADSTDASNLNEDEEYDEDHLDYDSCNED